MENLIAHKTVAYLRISTLDQNTEKSKTDILHFANQHDLGKVHFVEEVCSGKTAWRDRLIAQLLNELKPHDVIIVSELSRLGRSMLECMEILAFATRKEIRIYSVKGNWQLNDTIQSKIIALAFSMAAVVKGI
jgi:DNA invertase Pin-like site-specific DNA recombinase